MFWKLQLIRVKWIVNCPVKMMLKLWGKCNTVSVLCMLCSWFTAGDNGSCRRASICCSSVLHGEIQKQSKLQTRSVNNQFWLTLSHLITCKYHVRNPSAATTASVPISRYRYVSNIVVRSNDKKKNIKDINNLKYKASYSKQYNDTKS